MAIGNQRTVDTPTPVKNRTIANGDRQAATRMVLDSENATALLDIMYKLSREQKTTFIFSTHDRMVSAYVELYRALCGREAG